MKFDKPVRVCNKCFNQISVDEAQKINKDRTSKRLEFDQVNKILEEEEQKHLKPQKDILKKSRYDSLRRSAMKMSPTNPDNDSHSKYTSKLPEILRIQSFYRMLKCRKPYLKKKKAAIIIQSLFRGRKARKQFAVLKETAKVEKTKENPISKRRRLQR